jgi:hypothetical protein
MNIHSPFRYSFPQQSCRGTIRILKHYHKAENSLAAASICRPDEQVHPYAHQTAHSWFNIFLVFYHPSSRGVDFDGNF